MSKKKKMNMDFAGKTVKTVVGGSIGLGVGSSMLGAMGQGAIATKTMVPAANMLGVVGSAGMGMGVLDMVKNMTKKKKK